MVYVREKIHQIRQSEYSLEAKIGALGLALLALGGILESAGVPTNNPGLELGGYVSIITGIGELAIGGAAAVGRAIHNRFYS